MYRSAITQYQAKNQPYNLWHGGSFPLWLLQESILPCFVLFLILYGSMFLTMEGVSCNKQSFCNLLRFLRCFFSILFFRSSNVIDANVYIRWNKKIIVGRVCAWWCLFNRFSAVIVGSFHRLLVSYAIFKNYIGKYIEKYVLLDFAKHLSFSEAQKKSKLMFRWDFRKKGVCSKSTTKTLYRNKFLVRGCIFKLVCHCGSCISDIGCA